MIKAVSWHLKRRPHSEEVTVVWLLDAQSFQDSSAPLGSGAIIEVCSDTDVPGLAV